MTGVNTLGYVVNHLLADDTCRSHVTLLDLVHQIDRMSARFLKDIVVDTAIGKDTVALWPDIREHAVAYLTMTTTTAPSSGDDSATPAAPAAATGAIGAQAGAPSSGAADAVPAADAPAPAADAAADAAAPAPVAEGDSTVKVDGLKPEEEAASLELFQAAALAEMLEEPTPLLEEETTFLARFEKLRDKAATAPAPKDEL